MNDHFFEKNTVFVTDDGYRLEYEDGVWTDGDLVFRSNEKGLPVDEFGVDVEGLLVQVD